MPINRDAAAINTIIPIQALRAAAALAVILTHYSIFFLLMTGRRGALEQWMVLFDPFGAGVDVFFVISGFVMVYSSEPLFGKARAPLIFMAHRIARIVPLYWATTAINLLISGGVDARSLISSCLFIPFTNKYSGGIQPLYGIGWTLNFEMLFYVVFAGCLFLRQSLVLVALAGTLLGAVAIGHIVPISQAAPLVVWTDPLVIEFLLGVGIAVIYRQGLILPKWLRVAMALGAVIVIWHYHPGQIPSQDRWAQWGVPAAMIVAASTLGARRPPTGGAFEKAAKSFGDASYSLYMLHTLVYFLVIVRLDNGFGPIAVNGLLTFGCGLTIALSLLTYRFFERPMMRLLKRLFTFEIAARTVVAPAVTVPSGRASVGGI